MGIFDDSFSIELNHPLDKEAWKVLEDAELDNTEHIYFTTPSGKRVDFIKADVLDKIKAEIKQERVGYPPNADYYRAIMRCWQIIDKYKAESDKEGEE